MAAGASRAHGEGNGSGTMVLKEEGGSDADNKRYSSWKTVVPFLYDQFLTHDLQWPSLSARLGPVVLKKYYRNTHLMYLSEQTDGTLPNTLVKTNVDLFKPRIMLADQLCEFQLGVRSKLVKTIKTIFHPGEVNKIRDFPQNADLVVTHSDCPEIYVWNWETQPNRNSKDGQDQLSKPDLILSGHEENAPFALEVSTTDEPLVLSGGEDHKVLLWNLKDFSSAAAATSKDGGSSGRSSWNSGGKGVSNKKNSPRLQPASTFTGHKDVVSDVAFCAGSEELLCSVADDKCLLVWDSRAGTGPVAKVEDAHAADILSVDWCAMDTQYMCTGSSDTTVNIYDRRMMDSPKSVVHVLKGHGKDVTCTVWSPHSNRILASGGGDGVVNVWNIDNIAAEDELLQGKLNGTTSPGLIFKHMGHRAEVSEIQWSPYEPWTMLSISTDTEVGGGGTLQIWRISDMITRPEADVLEELNKYKEEILINEKKDDDTTME